MFARVRDVGTYVHERLLAQGLECFEVNENQTRRLVFFGVDVIRSQERGVRRDFVEAMKNHLQSSVSHEGKLAQGRRSAFEYLIRRGQSLLRLLNEKNFAFAEVHDVKAPQRRERMRSELLHINSEHIKEKIAQLKEIPSIPRRLCSRP